MILRNPFSKKRDSKREDDLKALNEALLGRANAVVKKAANPIESTEEEKSES